MSWPSEELVVCAWWLFPQGRTMGRGGIYPPSTLSPAPPIEPPIPASVCVRVSVCECVSLSAVVCPSPRLVTPSLTDVTGDTPFIVVPRRSGGGKAALPLHGSSTLVWTRERDTAKRQSRCHGPCDWAAPWLPVTHPAGPAVVIGGVLSALLWAEDRMKCTNCKARVDMLSWGADDCATPVPSLRIALQRPGAPRQPPARLFGSALVRRPGYCARTARVLREKGTGPCSEAANAAQRCARCVPVDEREGLFCSVSSARQGWRSVMSAPPGESKCPGIWRPPRSSPPSLVTRAVDDGLVMARDEPVALGDPVVVRLRSQPGFEQFHPSRTAPIGRGSGEAISGSATRHVFIFNPCRCDQRHLRADNAPRFGRQR